MKFKIGLVVSVLLAFNLYANNTKEVKNKGEIEIGGVTLLDKYPKKRLDWYEATSYCKSIGGRLPSVEEFRKIYAKVRNKSKLFGKDRFWASNEWINSDDKAYYFYFDIDNAKWRTKSSNNHVRCAKK